MLTNPVRGARYLWQGMRLITKPELRAFVVVPLLVNVLIFALAILLGIHQFAVLMDQLMALVPGWLAWLEWLLWPLFGIVLLILVFHVFALVANVIAAPFNNLLATKVEQLVTGRSIEDEGEWRELLTTLVPTLLEEMRKLLYALRLALPCLLLIWVPVLGPLLWFVYTAWMLAVEYSDYPMGNHGLSFREMRERLGTRRTLSLGFGSAATAMSMVPVVNFLLMPSAVAGATLMWVREFRGSTSTLGANQSRVATRRVVLVIDHLSGRISGELRDGPHQGQALAAIPTGELLELLTRCYATDAESAEALEAYLSHERGQRFAEPPRNDDPPRDEQRTRRSRTTSSQETSRSMSGDEAREILGLPEQAADADIREAHRRLIQRLHPDRGGSAYLAAKVNEARDTLLR